VIVSEKPGAHVAGVLMPWLRLIVSERGAVSSLILFKKRCTTALLGLISRANLNSLRLMLRGRGDDQDTGLT
jgi:hypothetical protein